MSSFSAISNSLCDTFRQSATDKVFPRQQAQMRGLLINTLLHGFPKKPRADMATIDAAAVVTEVVRRIDTCLDDYKYELMAFVSSQRVSGNAKNNAPLVHTVQTKISDRLHTLVTQTCLEESAAILKERYTLHYQPHLSFNQIDTSEVFRVVAAYNQDTEDYACRGFFSRLGTGKERRRLQKGRILTLTSDAINACKAIIRREVASLLREDITKNACSAVGQGHVLPLP